MTSTTRPTTPAPPFTGAVFIATSLDGYIARRDGDIDWLVGRAEELGESGYDAFIAGIDCLVIGRGTYETALGFDSWPYEGRRVLVLSSRVDQGADPRVEVVRDLPAAVDALVAAGVRRVYVDGGRVIQSFLAAGLIHELTITTAPVLLGEGLPLFGALDRDVPLEHRSTTVLGAGFVQSVYAVLPAAPAGA